MDAVTVFFAEVAACVAISAFILVRLQRLLRRIGAEVCEQGGGATEFWLAYTQLMMLIAPVLLVSWFSSAGQYSSLVSQLKSSFGVVLSGQFIGLALVGRAVWRSIVRPAPKPAIPMRATPVPTAATS
jgi:hypothetical protein